ncbi:MAG: nitrite reductase (NAD(P)H) small subunit [Anaerolineae bacterium]|nr:nitrite reductase (NAD(P)H) small subunit [Anaerolineae bacterium]
MATAMPEEYVYVCDTGDLPPRGKKTVHVNGLTLLLIACDDQLYAIENSDPQTGGPMSHGKVIDCQITSPNNGATYDLRTGKYVGGGFAPLQSHWLTIFRVQVSDNKVYICTGS